MSEEQKGTVGMTRLRHLVARSRMVENRNGKINLSGIVSITIGDARAIAEDFIEMKKQRDEALRILKLRTVPKHKQLLPHTNVEPEPVKSDKKKPKIDPRWEKVIKNIK